MRSPEQVQAWRKEDQLIQKNETKTQGNSRDELAQDIKEANREFREGKALPTTPDDLMKEITSR